MIANKRPIISVFLFLFVLAAMVVQIEPRIYTTQTRQFSNDPLFSLLGSAKEAIGDAFFLKASSYFHGGVDNEFIPSEEAFGSEADPEHEQEEVLGSFKKTYADWIYRVNSQIKVMDHRHLEGDETKEMLPFLRIAVSLDPYNIPAVLTTAYWLQDYFKKTDDAIDVLREGLKNNPDSWEISYQLGLSFFKLKKDHKQSAIYLKRSLDAMKDSDSDDITRRMLLYYLGESYRSEGLKDEALSAYQRSLTYFGEQKNLSIEKSVREKIKNLSETP